MEGRGPQSYRLTETESLLFQHWWHVYLARPPLSPSNLVYPNRKYPLTNSLSVSALFPTLLLQFVP